MLTEFADDIWIAEGPTLVAAAGFQYPTRMAVIRLSGGRLFVWSPVALTESLRAAVTALGMPHALVAPNHLHDSYIAEWAAAFPAAKVFAAPGLAQKRPDLHIAGELGDAPPPDWAGEVDQIVMAGNRITTEVVFFHAKSGTVILTDLVQHFPKGWFSGWRGVIARLDAMVGAEPQVPRKFRLAFTNRRAARVAVDRLLHWPAQRVLMAHGTPVTKDAAAFLRRAFAWLG